MSYTTITVPSVGDATKASLIQLIADNFDDHETRIALLWGAGILNGGFESGLDGWATDTTGGGTVAAEAGTFFAGLKSCKITLGSSNTYAEIQSGETDLVADFVPVGAGQRIAVRWAQKASAANIAAKVWLRWFDSAGSQVGADEEIYATADASTSWVVRSGSAVCPSGAKYYRVKIRGGDTVTDAGAIYVDAVASEIHHGHVSVVPAVLLHKHGDEDGTYDIDVRATLSLSDFPISILVGVETYSAGAPDTIGATLKGWAGGAWETFSAAHPIPLDPEGQIRIITSSDAASDYVTVTCYGYNV